MKSLSRLCGLAAAAFLLAMFASTARAADPGPQPCSRGMTIGCILTRLDGVNVYYNGGDPTAIQAANDYGLAWQCVELVQRYYALIHGYPGRWAPLYAFQIFDEGGHPSTMAAYPNGSAQGPERGDVLVFAPTFFGLFGHVAVVKSVENGRVTFVQENMGIVGEDALPIDARNNIASGYPYGLVRGWLKDTSGVYTTFALGNSTEEGAMTAVLGPVIGFLRDHSAGHPVAIFRRAPPTVAPSNLAFVSPYTAGWLPASVVRRPVARLTSRPAAALALAATATLTATDTPSPTAQPTNTPFPTATPRPTLTPDPTATIVPTTVVPSPTVTVPPTPVDTGTPVPTTPAPTATPAAQLGRIVLLNLYPDMDAVVTVAGQTYLVPRNGGQIVIALPAGHYTWVLQVGTLPPSTGAVDVVAGTRRLFTIAPQ